MRKQLALLFRLTLRTVCNFTTPVATPVSAPVHIVNHACIHTRISIRQPCVSCQRQYVKCVHKKASRHSWCVPFSVVTYAVRTCSTIYFHHMLFPAVVFWGDVLHVCCGQVCPVCRTKDYYTRCLIHTVRTYIVTIHSFQTYWHVL